MTVISGDQMETLMDQRKVLNNQIINAKATLLALESTGQTLTGLTGYSVVFGAAYTTYLTTAKGLIDTLIASFPAEPAISMNVS